MKFNNFKSVLFIIVLASFTAQPVQGMSYLRGAYKKVCGLCTGVKNYFYPSVTTNRDSKQPSLPVNQTNVQMPSTGKENDQKSDMQKQREQQLEALRKNITVNVSFLGKYKEKNELIMVYGVALNENYFKQVALAFVHFNTSTRVAIIPTIRVEVHKRNHLYGTLLLKAIRTVLQQIGCKRAIGHANPFDLRKGEDYDQMLPKLLEFYKRNGITVNGHSLVFDFPSNVNENSSKTENSPALTTQPVNGTVHDDTYQKAANRLQMIADHLNADSEESLAANAVHSQVSKQLELSRSLENITVNFDLLNKVVSGKQITEYYNVSLTEINSQLEVARATITFNATTQEAEVDTINVIQEKREHCYGTLLLRAIGLALQEKGCKKVTGQAAPYDLRPGEAPKAMLPKLLNFYTRNGIHVSPDYKLAFTFLGNTDAKKQQNNSSTLTTNPVHAQETAVDYEKVTHRLAMIANHLRT